MRTPELETAKQQQKIIGWERSDYSGGGIARVKVIETGFQAPQYTVRNPQRAQPRDHSMVEILSAAGMSDLEADARQLAKAAGTDVPYRRIVPNRELTLWTGPQERKFGLIMERESAVSGVVEAAAQAGIVVDHIDLITKKVTLADTEFVAVCERLAKAQRLHTAPDPRPEVHTRAAERERELREAGVMP